MTVDHDMVRLNESGFNRFASLLGIEFEHVEDGMCRAGIEVHENLFHPGGIVHGGVAFSLADSSMALSVIAGLDENEVCSTIETKISYFAPVTEGRMISEARVIKRGRHIAFLEARVSCGDRHIATATATFAIRLLKKKTSQGDGR